MGRFSAHPTCTRSALLILPGTLMKKTILVVDDSASIRQMVMFTLKTEGYSVMEAVDGEAGLAQAKSKAFQLILTDQNMPRMDGLSMLTSIRALPSYKTVPILMLTTESRVDLKNKGRAAGATGWLVKPFDPKLLVELVTKILGAP